MILRDEIITLEDNKKYFVIDSIMYDNKNYILIDQYNEETKDILGLFKIMEYNIENSVITKITDEELMKELFTKFDID